MLQSTRKFEDTYLFREAASYFEKYKRYDDGVKNSPQYKEYWKREKKRCINGYRVGDIHISGYHYFYLNYIRIIKVDVPVGKIAEVGKRRAGNREESFPDFWDVDYMFFKTLDIAEYGISKEDYEVYHSLTGLEVHPDDRYGGRHIIWLKPRGVGASYKGASLPLRNYCLLPKSKSFFLAGEGEYLTEDGTWSKWLDCNTWIRTHASGFARSNDFKKDRNKMHFRASYSMSDNEYGYMSEVMGVSLKNNPERARGKRGKVQVWEEFGKLPHGNRSWLIGRPSVEELDVNFGTMVGFGTGGTEGQDFEALRSAYYNPIAKNCIRIRNVFDENRQNTWGGLFTPAYYNVSLKDKDGNSDTVKAKAILDEERRKLESSPDPMDLTRYKAEMPYCPMEAVLNTARNIYLTETLNVHIANVEAQQLHKTMGVVGEVYRNSEGVVEFKLNNTLEPIHTYPHKSGTINKGAVIMYEKPYRDESGAVPKDLYTLDVDTYRHDTTTGDSIGSVYVCMNTNNFTGSRGDKIVACYNARPATQTDFNDILFMLAELYNGEIAFENDEPGDVIGYAKKNKLIKYLSNEFEMAYDDNIKSTNTTRGFGVRMGSGRDNKRIKQGDVFLKDMLYTRRAILPDGKVLLNLHLVYDLGLLQELASYNPDGNFDRISAMRVRAYHEQELLYNSKAPKGKRKSRNREFRSRVKYTNT